MNSPEQIKEAKKFIQEEGRRISLDHAKRNLYEDFYDPYRYFNFTEDGERDVREFDSIPLVRRNMMHARELRKLEGSENVSVVSGLCILPRSRQVPPYHDLPSMQLVQDVRVHQGFDTFAQSYFQNPDNFVVVASREYRDVTGQRFRPDSNFNREFDALISKLHALASEVPNNTVVDTGTKQKELKEIKDELKSKDEVKRRLGHYDGLSIAERVTTLGASAETIQEGILDTAATIYYPIAFGGSKRVVVLGSFNEMQTSEIVKNSGLNGSEDVYLVPFVYLPDLLNSERPMHSAGTTNGLLSFGDAVEEDYRNSSPTYELKLLRNKLRNATGHCKGGGKGVLDYLIASPQISDETLYKILVTGCPLYTGKKNKAACRNCEETTANVLRKEAYAKVLPEEVQSAFGPRDWDLLVR